MLFNALQCSSMLFNALQCSSHIQHNNNISFYVVHTAETTPHFLYTHSLFSLCPINLSVAASTSQTSAFNSTTLVESCEELMCTRWVPTTNMTAQLVHHQCVPGLFTYFSYPWYQTPTTTSSHILANVRVSIVVCL